MRGSAIEILIGFFSLAVSAPAVAAPPTVLLFPESLSSPKDMQALSDLRSNLRQAEIRLLRLTGQLELWLKSAAAARSPASPGTPAPTPR